MEETEDWDDFIARAAKALPHSALVLDVDDPDAGDDDEGSRAVIAFDLTTAAAADDEA